MALPYTGEATRDEKGVFQRFCVIMKISKGCILLASALGKQIMTSGAYGSYV
jgi:hypothetical protein